MIDNFCLKVVSYTEAQKDIQWVRQIVFQNEQNVNSELDFDGLDEGSIHLLAYQNEQPIGTSRIRFLNNSLAKLERVAVLKAFRGKGIGTLMTQVAIDFLRQKQVPEIKINAQLHAKDFYKKLGFYPIGDQFEEAGILHLEMRKRID